MVEVLADVVKVVVLAAGPNALLRVRRGGELGQSQSRVGCSKKQRLKLEPEREREGEKETTKVIK